MYFRLRSVLRPQSKTSSYLSWDTDYQNWTKSKLSKISVIKMQWLASYDSLRSQFRWKHRFRINNSNDKLRHSLANLLIYLLTKGFGLWILNAKINFLRIEKMNLFQTSRCLFQDGELVRSHDDAAHVTGAWAKRAWPCSPLWRKYYSETSPLGHLYSRNTSSYSGDTKFCPVKMFT